MLEPKIGLLYSGQGSQKAGLGKDFYENYPEVRELFDAHPQIRDLILYGSEEELAQTQNTQRVLILYHIAVTKLLQKEIPISAAMGISLGEYGALYAAKVLSEEDTIRTISFRADAMADACQARNLSSVAVLNQEWTWLLENEGDSSYYISNINSPSQMVITGENLTPWLEKILAQGYKKIIPLAVSGGFHSPYMKTVEEKLLHYFKDMNFREPEIPIFFNYGENSMDIKQRMAEQVSHTIHVHRSLENICAACDILIEIGANKILEKMVKKIDRQKTVFALESISDFEKVREHIGK